MAVFSLLSVSHLVAIKQPKEGVGIVQLQMIYASHTCTRSQHCTTQQTPTCAVVVVSQPYRPCSMCAAEVVGLECSSSTSPPSEQNDVEVIGGMVAVRSMVQLVSLRNTYAYVILLHIF